MNLCLSSFFRIQNKRKSWISSGKIDHYFLNQGGGLISFFKKIMQFFSCFRFPLFLVSPRHRIYVTEPPNLHSSNLFRSDLFTCFSPAVFAGGFFSDPKLINLRNCLKIESHSSSCATTCLFFWLVFFPVTTKRFSQIDMHQLSFNQQALEEALVRVVSYKFVLTSSRRSDPFLTLGLCSAGFPN